jgi:hypothetical protein
MSLKDKILSCVDVKSKIVHIDEWDADIEVREMNGKCRAMFVELVTKEELKDSDIVKAYPQIIQHCAFDPETKERIFDESDVDALSEKNGNALDKIVTEVIELSSLTQKSVDEAGKNSTAIQN